MRRLSELARYHFGKKSISKLTGSFDARSVEEFVLPHMEAIKYRRDIKGMFTSDPWTIDVAREILRSNSRSEFFERKIFTQPVHLNREASSVRVRISDIRDFPDFYRSYKSKKTGDDKEVMICVGGPAAEDQTALASMIPEIRERLNEVIYITRDYIESNVNHSAKQSHARHGNALNADETLTGHALLPSIVMRNLIGVSLEEAMEPDFRKVDVKFTIDPKKLRIYFGNELNWMKQEYIRRYGGEGALTEHDINRIESTLSQEIMKVFEEQSGTKVSAGVAKALEKSSAIHVTFTEQNTREVKHENAEFERAGIFSEELPPSEIKRFFGDRPEIHSAFRYPGDTHMVFDTHDRNREYAEKMGASWLDGVEIKRIFLTKNEAGNAEIAGLLDASGNYQYCNKLHFSGGYKVDYVFDKDSISRFKSGRMLRDVLNFTEDLLNLQKPLSNEITTSTGVSVNAIFKKTDRMKALIDEYGSTGEIAITNSHWTMIAQNEEYVIMRMTGGGNTGSEEYNPAYFINLLANTRRIFGDELVGILSTYGCPRAVNARNTTEFAKIAEGAVVSYGKGGTGNTKRHIEAATGLMLLGFDREVVEYFNKFYTRNSHSLGDEIDKMHQLMNKFEFFHDNVERTNRRMGYDQSMSAQEMIAICLLSAAAIYGLSEKKEEIEKGRVDKLERPEANPKISFSSSLVNPVVLTTKNKTH